MKRFMKTMHIFHETRSSTRKRFRVVLSTCSIINRTPETFIFQGFQGSWMCNIQLKSLRFSDTCGIICIWKGELCNMKTSLCSIIDKCTKSAIWGRIRQTASKEAHARRALSVHTHAHIRAYGISWKLEAGNAQASWKLRKELASWMNTRQTIGAGIMMMGLLQSALLGTPIFLLGFGALGALCMIRIH